MVKASDSLLGHVHRRGGLADRERAIVTKDDDRALAMRQTLQSSTYEVPISDVVRVIGCDMKIAAEQTVDATSYALSTSFRPKEIQRNLVHPRPRS